jgi:serine/threonine protein kinase
MLYAVDAIHRKHIVHSDLKPANFVLAKGRLKLIDFGIAKKHSDDTTSIHRDIQVSCNKINSNTNTNNLGRLVQSIICHLKHCLISMKEWMEQEV